MNPANVDPDTSLQIMPHEPMVEHVNQSDKATVDKEREMAELLITMDNYTSIIPDNVIEYYLNRTGFECDDARIKKLFAMAAQKFVADIATDAFQFNKVKQSGSRNTSKSKDKKTVLSMEDLSSALAEHGVDAKKPEYYH
ncbi:transcription initiation factor TFIID 23-30kDa subunit-domain-containing protein [Gilbertella persicaria]|uniref:Transcription initiation factor TFIID subunit 10 n=1 Tax=Rhizopus stolonifer TaxID=4846 RepID=A0A367JK54_RHIST|nr:transcription initiation factor TFIID 23-30kDa subunit-domain-containing protein [Gilbertella persicaria]KAI8076638.1 transcription initiation factor TFIID 23-30kDa subunit-domain-containing protein [Gilbertella persicaria]RCH90081.1 Transcription initiation factor TFIID subunit 10 [Rhizopus stolonifer]